VDTSEVDTLSEMPETKTIPKSIDITFAELLRRRQGVKKNRDQLQQILQ